MAEVFYDMSHLTTDELRELFTSYRRLSWIDYEYEVLDEKDDYRRIFNNTSQKLSVELI